MGRGQGEVLCLRTLSISNPILSPVPPPSYPSHLSYATLPVHGEREIPLAKICFVLQSSCMNPNWAEENLQTIRTLMERSALYRRALTPIMLLAGILGVAAAAIGSVFHLDPPWAFEALWLCTAVVAVAGTLLIARQQALKENEAFWSPPTRRVVQAALPPLLAGLCLGLFPRVIGDLPQQPDLMASVIWVLFYGCALHSAGFFMPRGIKVFGWLFILGGCLLLFALSLKAVDFQPPAHWLMGFFFGLLHLAYAAYLFLTGKGKNAA